LRSTPILKRLFYTRLDIEHHSYIVYAMFLLRSKEKAVTVRELRSLFSSIYVPPPKVELEDKDLEKLRLKSLTLRGARPAVFGLLRYVSRCRRLITDHKRPLRRYLVSP